MNDKDTSPIEFKLAELIYYRWGATMIASGRFNELPRGQLEHHCLARGLLTYAQLSGLSNFVLMVHLKHDQWSADGYFTKIPALPTPDSGYDTDADSDQV